MFAFPLYTVALCVGAGLTGLYVRHLAGSLGYVCGFQTELMLTAVGACAYLAAQMLFMAFVRAIKPTRSPTPVAAESISQLAALVFIPYILGMGIPQPDGVPQHVGRILEYVVKAEPRIYLGAFLVLHVFFKLVAFFAAMRGEPAGRLPAIGWLSAACVSGLAASAFAHSWANNLELARPRADAKSAYCRVGDTFARAREVPEGVAVSFSITDYDGGGLAFGWANVPPEKTEPNPLEEAYATFTLEGRHTTTDSVSVTLSDTGWAELYIPADQVPEGLQRATIMWDAQKQPVWLRFAPLRPIPASNRRLLLSGPFIHAEEDSSGKPSFLVIAVDGLNAGRMSCLGYKRSTTPNIDKFAARATVFTNAYTSAPEAAAACMTLLTGVSPLRHGYLGGHLGPLPNGYDTLAAVLQNKHYATAAFTEGEGNDPKDIVFGTGFEKGFEVFDASYRAAPPATDASALSAPALSAPALSAAAYTLDKAGTWIDNHAGERFFVFVRLRELRRPNWADRYSPGFVENPADIYDSALGYIDHHIGALINAVRANPATKDTAIIITSTYGLDFTTATFPAARLTEESLRIPIIITIPATAKTLGKASAPQTAMASRDTATTAPHSDWHKNPVALADIMPTILDLAQTGLDYATEGRSLISDTTGRTPISVQGDPLALSLRQQQWRFTWQSGLTPFTYQGAGSSSIIEFYNLDRAQRLGKKTNDTKNNQDLATQYEQRLRTYLAQFTGSKRQ